MNYLRNWFKKWILYFFCWCKWVKEDPDDNLNSTLNRAPSITRKIGRKTASMRVARWCKSFPSNFSGDTCINRKNIMIHFLSFHIFFFWKTDCSLDLTIIYSRTIFRKFGRLRIDTTAFQDENKLWLPPWFKQQTIVILYLWNKNKFEQILPAQFIFE